MTRTDARLQLAEFEGLPVIGGKECEAVTQTPKHEETFKIGQGIKVTALHTPCHTQDSICYFLEDGNDKVVFTGDTLFIGGEIHIPACFLGEDRTIMLTFAPLVIGCGRFFEGTAQEMDTALNKVLGSLPDDTKVYVSDIAFQADEQSEHTTLITLTAGPRVHKVQCQVPGHRLTERAHQEAAVFR